MKRVRTWSTRPAGVPDGYPVPALIPSAHIEVDLYPTWKSRFAVYHFEVHADDRLALHLARSGERASR